MFSETFYVVVFDIFGLSQKDQSTKHLKHLKQSAQKLSFEHICRPIENILENRKNNAYQYFLLFSDSLRERRIVIATEFIPLLPLTFVLAKFVEKQSLAGKE